VSSTAFPAGQAGAGEPGREATYDVLLARLRGRAAAVGWPWCRAAT